MPKPTPKTWQGARVRILADATPVCHCLSCDVKSFALRLNEAQCTTKAEAVSEFAEKLKAIIDNNDNFDRGVFSYRSDEINVLIDLAVKQLYPTTTVEHT